MIEWLRRLGQPWEAGIILGHGRLYSEPRKWERPIVLPDRLENKHGVLWGKSGMGKSRELYPIVMQKIRLGETVFLFDSHNGWLHVLDAIGQEIGPEELGDRLCVIDPSCVEYGVVGLNVLELEPGLEIFGVVEELVSAFKSIWADSFGDRMADLIRHSCWTLAEHGLTLQSFTRLLSDAPFRRGLVSGLKSEESKVFWRDHFESLRKGDQAYIIESSRNKVSALMLNPYAKLMLAQKKSTVRFRDLINHPRGGIILVHVSRNHLKTDQQRLLGALIFSKLYMAILARERIPEAERRPVNIFLEEASEIYNPDSVLNILSGARKLQIILWLCFQSIAQLAQRDVSLILNGAAVNIVFCCTREEAQRLIGIFNFSGTHVKNEERDIFGTKGRPTYYSVQEEQENALRELTTQRGQEFYVRIVGDDSDEPYIGTAEFVEYPPVDEELRAQLRKLSASFYMRPYDKVLREIEQQSFGGEERAGYNESESFNQKSTNGRKKTGKDFKD